MTNPAEMAPGRHEDQNPLRMREAGTLALPARWSPDDQSTKGHKMTENTFARVRVAALIFSMVNAVVFGAGIVAILTIPALAAHASFWIPALVLASFLLSPPLSWFLAPRMMLRYTRASQFVHARSVH